MPTQPDICLDVTEYPRYYALSEVACSAVLCSPAPQSSVLESLPLHFDLPLSALKQPIWHTYNCCGVPLGSKAFVSAAIDWRPLPVKRISNDSIGLGNLPSVGLSRLALAAIIAWLLFDKSVPFENGFDEPVVSMGLDRSSRRYFDHDLCRRGKKCPIKLS